MQWVYTDSEVYIDLGIDVMHGLHELQEWVAVVYNRPTVMTVMTRMFHNVVEI